LISRLWNNIQLSPLEAEVGATLQVIAPDVERVSIRSDPGTPQGLMPIVKVAGSSQPFPLRTMGDGMVRLFGIALALVNARDGFLLIDEIENGLHYSIQPDVWRLIFRVASRLNVQVLATTHSWDCIEAFQKAAAESESAEGMLIRLESLRGKVVATSFDREDLAVITRDYLEVR
jgi:predicted ATPase